MLILLIFEALIRALADRLPRIGRRDRKDALPFRRRWTFGSYPVQENDSTAGTQGEILIILLRTYEAFPRGDCGHPRLRAIWRNASS